MNSFPKALIIGLGGLGSDIVCDIYTRFNQHNEHKDDHAKVRFLALDTDSNEVAARRKIMNPDDVIQTSSTTDVVAGKYIDDIRKISSVEQWFPIETRELLKMSINDGAGQIRAISRLAFSHAIHTGKLDRVKKVIDELLNVNADEGNIIEVHIVTSLAGGTGAGSFLQMAYYVREALIARGINNPKVLGYFMLGDVFLHDPSINLSDSNKTTSILANTYACIKELNGIYNIKENQSIPFEFGDFARSNYKITINNSIPYTQCFLLDYENKDGNNIGSVKNYKNQLGEFIYLNAFSPTGPKTRSEQINNIFNQIRSGSDSRYGSTGISKIVYPVDNLLAYFSNRRLNDNLKSTWLKIDKDFEKLHDEWRINTNKGIITKEPILSDYYIRNVESLAKNATGAEQAIFNSILQSTKIIDEESLDIIGDKTDFLLQNIQEYLARLRDQDSDLDALSRIGFSEDFKTSNDNPDNDKATIKNIEDTLEALKRETFDFIDETKRLALEEIFVKDISSYNYHNDEVKYRFNTYILEKDKAMHPIAQRYFYYQILQKLEDTYNYLSQENVKKLGLITAYDTIYDIKNDDEKDDGIIESAVDAFNIYYSNDNKIIKKLTRLTGGSSDLSQFKEEYVSKSQRQARELKQYALTKLQEFVYGGLISQVKIMIENLERLFKTIPEVNTGLKNKYKALASITSSGDPSVVYVLAKEEHREHIYKESVAKKDTIFFPEDMSRSIYEELFNATYQQINDPIYYANNNTSTRIKWIFEKMVVDKQIKNFKELFKDDFAGYNAIQAMRKQAELDGINAIDFMKSCFREAERKATPFGARYGNDDPKINTWAIHPECMESQYLTPNDANTLLNSGGAAQDNANRVISDYFEKTEIIREDSVMVLKVPEKYPKFAATNPDQKYSDSYDGIYYKYYIKRINEIHDNPELPTPHLDKSWTNPIIFKNLGVSDDTYKKSIIRAFFWGLSQGYIQAYNNYGTKVWTYNGPNSRGIDYIKGFNGRNIKLNIPKLINEGLWNNEQMVNEILSSVEKRINDSIETWREIRMTGKSIKTLDLVKNFYRFRFSDIEAFKSKNLLSIFNGYVTDNDSEIIDFIIDEIISTLIKITGNNEQDTKEKAASIFEGLIRSITDDGNSPITKKLVTSMIENKMNSKFNN